MYIIFAFWFSFVKLNLFFKLYFEFVSLSKKFIKTLKKFENKNKKPANKSKNAKGIRYLIIS
jgi:hypothetical protein